MKMENNLEEMNAYSTSWQQIQMCSPGACHRRARSVWWWGSDGVSARAASLVLPLSDPHLHYPLPHTEYPIVCWETSLCTIIFRITAMNYKQIGSIYKVISITTWIRSLSLRLFFINYTTFQKQNSTKWREDFTDDVVVLLLLRLHGIIH